VLQREECYRSAAALVTLTFLDPLYGHRMLQVQLHISLIVATSLELFTCQHVRNWNLWWSSNVIVVLVCTLFGIEAATEITPTWGKTTLPHLQ